MNTYEKLKISLRYFLLGAGYTRAADALEFAASYHTGMRKDGVTPEFQHQIEIAHYIRTLLPSLMYPEDTLIAALLHDVTEDYGVLHTIIDQRYGSLASTAVCLLDKNGKPYDVYFGAMAENPIASIVKGSDRMHNIQSMVGVFSAEKQLKYMQEVEQYFLPMLKNARRLYAKQEPAYENIKHVLISQLELLKAFHNKE